MWEISVEQSFSAAHQLREYAGRCERLHGHNWQVEVTVRAEQLDECGLALDFTELRAWTAEIVAELDHRVLNELPAFTHHNPSAEHIARHIFEGLARRVDSPARRVHRVRVTESPGCTAAYLGVGS